MGRGDLLYLCPLCAFFSEVLLYPQSFLPLFEIPRFNQGCVCKHSPLTF
jgi:hypothetical protein